MHKIFHKDGRARASSVPDALRSLGIMKSSENPSSEPTLCQSCEQIIIRRASSAGATSRTNDSGGANRSAAIPEAHQTTQGNEQSSSVSDLRGDPSLERSSALSRQASLPAPSLAQQLGALKLQMREISKENRELRLEMVKIYSILCQKGLTFPDGSPRPNGASSADSSSVLFTASSLYFVNVYPFIDPPVGDPGVG